MEELKEQIQVVIEARHEATVAKEAVKMAQEKWEEENDLIIAEAFNANRLVIEEEGRLRELTLQSYAETGEKAVAPGVGIRETTKLEYDTKTAFDWAVGHTMALKLDTSAFEKIVKADPPDFVKITTEPQATIATELNKVE
ncbi:hypothetical protein LCGC14_3130580 [marine sediment metagenome]|uniref:Uncharacterized protein n=1 Tax=marine sediment metagenome TaxID=412755 RepID=A0A0F8VZV8_9ZZZZ